MATGVVLGHSGRPRPRRGPRVQPLTALERSILPALRRPPCVVSFSGGMDSSFVLAAAARLACQERLPAPIPVTWRFTGAPLAEESAWQERVVAGLGLDDWQILRADDDLDLVGPVAQRLLRRFGVVHPANAHLHLPIIELARAGSMLTGVGGDQILSGFRSLRRQSVVKKARSRLPGLIVDLVHRREDREAFPWLHRRHSLEVSSGYRREVRAEPRRLDRRIHWHAGRRDMLMACSTLEAVCDDNDVRLVNPLLDGEFVTALAEDLGERSGLSRSTLLRHIAGSTLPGVATETRPKAFFREVFIREPTRQFVSTWAGDGADEGLVDIEALTALWSTWPIPSGTAGLVQQLFLATRARPAPSHPTGGSDDRTAE